MKEMLESAVAQMPDAIAKSAPAMVSRIVEAMQLALARDAQLPNMSYCALLMKLGANDVTRAFLADLSEAVAQLRKPLNPAAAATSMAGLWLEPIGEADPSLDTMQQSNELFGRVVAKARALGVKGVDAYGKAFFLGPLNQALVKARIDDVNIARIMPYACRALDAELVSLYSRMEPPG
jgi:uncharacterized protein YigA (DUF484 family)